MPSIPYVQQEHPHWCGPAALLMVLKFFGMEKTQADLATLLKTSPEKGTNEEMMETVARDLGFDARTGSGVYEEIVRALEGGSMVIVAFVEPQDGEGHYAVVTDANSDRIRLLDPASAKDAQTILTKEGFIKRWGKKYSAHHQWFMILKPQKR